MQIRRAVSLAFRCMTGFAMLAVLAGGGLIAWNLHFAMTAEVRPGVFEYYRIARIPTRVRDSSGRYHTSHAEESRPVFSYTDASGNRVAVESTEAHVIAYLDRGDAIEVLVDPAGEREPLIKGFVPLAADGLALILVGALFAIFAEVVRSVVLRWLGDRLDRPGRASVSGGRSSAAAQAASAAPASPAVVQRGGSGAGRLVLAGVCLLAAAGGVFWWLGTGSPGTAPVAERIADESASPGLPAAEPGATLEPAAPEEAQQTADDPPAAAPAAAPRERSPVEVAARRGDHEALARELAAGGDIADVPPAVVKTLVAKEDIDTLRLLFEHGFDLTRHYARQTFGDQAVRARSAEVVRLVRAHGGVFEAPPEFVALAAMDPEALADALAQAPAERRWRGMTLDSFARHPDSRAMLEQVRGR